jgi:hypothetical protein
VLKCCCQKKKGLRIKEKEKSWEESFFPSGVAQKYGSISKMIFRRFKGHQRGYRPTEI